MADETEEEMLTRLEQEERARMEAEEQFERADEQERAQMEALEVEERAAMLTAVSDEEPQTIAITSGLPGQVDLKEVARRFGLLGVIAFGGPPAHVALMEVQSWRPGVVDDASFASLFALTQCLPGPSSTQLAIALGLLQGGKYGGLVAFGCFSATATISMTVLASACATLPHAPNPPYRRKNVTWL